MSLVAQTPQPSLAWQFESSNVDSVTGLAPSSSLQPGPGYLNGTAALVTNAPTNNTAVLFDGTTGCYMTLGASGPTNFDTNSSNLFVEAWVRAISTANPTRIYGRGASISSTVSYDFTFRINGGILGVANGTTTVSAPGTVTSGVWYHCALSITTTGLTTVFLNGLAGTPTVITMPYRSTYDTYIGAMTNQYTNGYIRDIRVVQGGIVPTTNFTPGAAPFSYNNLPNYVTGVGTTVFTLLSQFFPVYVPGKYNQAIRFDNEGATGTGAISYVTYSLSSSFSPTSFTWAHWVNFRQIPAQTIQFPLYFTDSLASSPFIRVGLNPGGVTGNGTQPYLYNGTSYLLGPVLTLGVWYHFCVVLTAGSGGSTATFYVNGTSYGSIVLTNNQAATINTMYVGSASTSYGALCSVDDLRLFNTALTAARVQAVYSASGMPRQMAQTNTVGSTKTTLTGTPLFSQLSSAASSSAVGAFSLRAVNGTTAKAVQVSTAAEFPPGVFPGPGTTVGPFTVSLTGYSFGGTGTYTTLASSVVSTSNAPWRAFDGAVPNSRWASAATYTANSPYTGTASTTAGGVVYPGEWIQLQFPQAMIISSYSLYPYTTNLPATWNVFASNDGTTWNVIDQRGSQTLVQGQYNNYPISGNITPYSYYRIGCYVVSDSTFVAIVEMKLYGSTKTSTDFYADRLGNLLTAPVTGQTLANWLGGATGYVTTWYDQSGRGRNATGTLATLTQTSNVNQQWAVNPTNGGLSLSGGAFLNGTDFTIACTTKRLGTQGNDGVYGYGANSSWVAQASVATTYGDNTRFALVMPNAGSTAVAFNDSSYSAAFSSNANVLPSTFVGATEPTVYTAVTLTGATQRMYINGTANGLPISSLTQVTANASTGFTIGTVNYYGGFLGEIGELLIFNNALAAADISTLYSAR